MFSDEVRATIDTMPAGTELTMMGLADLMGVTGKNYKTRSPRISAILSEKLDLGSLERPSYGLYRKVKTVVTIKKRTGKKPATREKRAYKSIEKMVIHKGIIYASRKEFLKTHPVTRGRLDGRIARGYFDGYAIFLTKSKANAEYYAKNFANTINIKINVNDPDELY